MKAIAEKILQVFVILLFVSSLIGTPLLVNAKYQEYLVEYENADVQEKTYEALSYTIYQSPSGKRLYYNVKLENGETYVTKNVEYIIGSENAFYLVFTKRDKSSYMEYFVSPFIEGAKDIYDIKLVVVTKGE